MFLLGLCLPARCVYCTTREPAVGGVTPTLPECVCLAGGRCVRVCPIALYSLLVHCQGSCTQRPSSIPHQGTC